ncbi:hypothetical protein T484DRAFT_1803808 [Baffinella frigidus]|nr:hypothetical protein T484DRAFT_1803808 [Cryptophyta sp. CCMP2293]
MLDVKLDAEQIKRFTLLNVNNRLGHDVRDKVMPVWTEMGEATGMCEKLLTSTTSGVRSSEKEERQEKFGRNYVEPPPLTPFWRFCLDALEDPTLQFLIVAAIVSLLVGSIFEAKCLGYLDGIAILVAVWVVVFVGAAQEAGKQVQFRSLTDSASDELVNVVRDGVQTRISNRDSAMESASRSASPAAT